MKDRNGLISEGRVRGKQSFQPSLMQIIPHLKVREGRLSRPRKQREEPEGLRGNSEKKNYLYSTRKRISRSVL